MSKPADKVETIVDNTVSFVGYKFINWLILHFGFDTAMIIKNLIIYFAGGLTFSIITFIGLNYLRYKVKMVDNIKGVSMLHIKNDDKKHIYVQQPTSVSEAIESLFGIVFYFITFKRIPLILSNNKRRKFFTWLTILLMLAFLIFGTMLAIRVVK